MRFGYIAHSVCQIAFIKSKYCLNSTMSIMTDSCNNDLIHIRRHMGQSTFLCRNICESSRVAHRYHMHLIHLTVFCQ